ncbi:hypothetical protein ABID59_001277 [Bradyrhizobium sp. S3.3.6]|uniref:hypothetical protein n=1 Tax=Bradyrhizobium sp. S3.3.6 TaxID=3156429 RepID=UPI003393632A
MEISLRLAQDIVEALDKVIDAVEKLGTMVYKAGQTANEVLERGFAKRTEGRLRALSTKTTYLVESMCPRLLNSIEQYLNLRDAQQWDEFQKELQNTLIAVGGLSDKIEGSSKALATTDFFPVLVSAVTQRELVLANFAKMKPPTSHEEIEAAKALVEKYARLLVVLSNATKQLGGYIEALEAKKA